MNYRAKCRLCKTVIESKKNDDYITCACGEISIDYHYQGTTQFIAREWENFIRIDDEGNEVQFKVVEKDDISSAKPHPKGISPPSKDELFSMLNQMIKNYEELPPQAMGTPVTHYDLLSALLLLSAILRASCKADS